MRVPIWSCLIWASCLIWTEIAARPVGPGAAPPPSQHRPRRPCTSSRTPSTDHRRRTAKGGAAAIRANQSQSEPIRANQSQSVPISANQCQSMPIRANQSQTEPIIRGHQHAIISMPSSACNHAPAPGRLARWAVCSLPPPHRTTRAEGHSCPY